MMRSLSAQRMLDVWERGLNQPPLQQALIMLVAAYPDISPVGIAELSIGQRDAALLRLREHLFGSRLVNTAICPACSEQIEWSNDIADVWASPHKQPERSASVFELEVDGYRLQCRLPNSLDIAGVLDGDEPETADPRQRLLARCVQSARRGDDVLTIDRLPERVIHAVAMRVEELDPQAEVRIGLNCPACSHRWELLFDIASFLWIELDEWAEWMLQTIHKLARNYGWAERDILSLSPVRRQLYSGLIGS
jgi:hypothetical protein